MFYKFFIPAKVNGSLNINNKLVYTSYLTSCRTTYDLTLSLNPRKLGKFRRISNIMELSPIAHFSVQKANFVNTSKETLKIEIELFVYCAISHKK